jgi:hypothetical protein
MNAKNVLVGVPIDGTWPPAGVRGLAKLEALSDMFALRDHDEGPARKARTFDAAEFASDALDAE